MKKTYIAILTAAAGLCSCIEMMDSASQADVVNPLNVSFKVKAVTGFVDADGNGTINTDFPVDGLTVRFTNFEEDAVIETLTDENGNVLDIYTVDPKTGTGTDSSNAEVNLPQTGNNSMTNWLLCVGAAMFMAFGFGAVKASGVLKRKEDE